MATSADAAGIEILVSRNLARERTRSALRLFVGRGRRYTVKELSNGTGVPDRMIEAAMCAVDDTDYRPLTLENLMSIGTFLGAPFVSAFLEPCGLGAFELSDQQPLPQVFDACKSPDKLTRDEHIRKAREHLDAAEQAA
jgi:hypothetical protein